MYRFVHILESGVCIANMKKVPVPSSLINRVLSVHGFACNRALLMHGITVNRALWMHDSLSTYRRHGGITGS